MRGILPGLLVIVLCQWGVVSVHAAVLPADRADVMYHSYKGGGVEVDGPTVLVRKSVGTSTSAYYKYNTDMVSSASVDVLMAASPYEEERTEQSAGVDYLRGRTTMSMSYTDSSENDYQAGTLNLSISQDFFGDLTTLDMGYSLGNDEVSRRDSDKLADINRQNYRVSLTQILTKDWLISGAWETITDEGTEVNNSGVTLNNPYRSYRYYNDPTDPSAGFTLAPEKYPRTRTSNAIAFRTSYYLPYRAALHGEYSYFQDSWGVTANTFELGYSHPIDNWTIDATVRFYDQSQADFYADIFDARDIQNFMARDKELSTFSSRSFGVSASYEFAKNGWGFIDKGSLNASWEHIEFNYDDFRDATVTGFDAGGEPLYSFSANVLQFYISIWY
jgi:hypothetical protein